MARPSLYDPSYCDEIVAFMKEGRSITAFAGHVGVARSTVFKWAKDHPEFAAALERGAAGATLWWEDRAREAATTGKGNPAVIIFGLKNRAPDDWKEVVRNEHTGKDGGPIQREEVTKEIDEFTREIARLAAQGREGSEDSRTKH